MLVRARCEILLSQRALELSMSKDKPKRTQVSVKGVVYDQLRDEAKRRGVSVVELADQILNGFFEPKTQKDSRSDMRDHCDPECGRD